MSFRLLPRVSRADQPTRERPRAARARCRRTIAPMRNITIMLQSMRSGAHSRRSLRALAFGLATAIAGSIAAPMVVTAAPPPSSSIVAIVAPSPALFATDVQWYVNTYRKGVASPGVFVQWQLNQAAQSHAAEMARRRYMTHTGADGSNGGTRISRTGYKWWIWGEDVAAGQTTGKQVTTAWYNSPSHRAVMLDRRYRHMGLGRAVASDGTVYWCLLLAS